MAALLADSLAGVKLCMAGDGHAAPVCAADIAPVPAPPAGAPLLGEPQKILLNR